MERAYVSMVLLTKVAGTVSVPNLHLRSGESITFAAVTLIIVRSMLGALEGFRALES